MSKQDVVYDNALNNIRVPSRLIDALDKYAKDNHATRSHIVRAALCHLLEVDMVTYIQIGNLREQEE